MDQAVIEGFRLSPQQRRLWKWPRAGTGLRAQAAFRLEGALDRGALRQALENVVARHEILRTAYHHLPGMELPLQVIGEAPRFAFRELARNGSEPAIQELLRQEAAAADLERELPARFALLPLGDREHLLAVTLPPASADDLSMANLLAAVAAEYAGVLSGSPPEDGGDGLQYADFSEWQNGLLEEEGAEARREFWRHRRERVPAPLWPRQPAGAAAEEPRFHRRWLDPVVTGEIDALARRQGASAPDVLLAVWLLLLRRLLDDPDLVVGWLADGRRFAQLEAGLGLFARYLPVSVPLQPDLTFSELLGSVRGVTEEALQHQEYFAEDGEGHGAALFPFLFDFAELPAPREAGGVRFILAESRVCFEPSDLRLSVRRSIGALRLELSCRPGFLDSGAAGRWLARYEALLRSALQDPECPVAELDLLDEQERLLLASWSRGPVTGLSDLAAHLHFEQQAARTPDALALVWDGGVLSYGELDRRANQLARYLSRHGLGTGSYAALVLERSAEQVIGLLAAWKAGAAFVPLDPGQPPQRLSRMIADLAATAAGKLVVLTRHALRGRVTLPGGTLVEIDGEAGPIGRERRSPLPAAEDPDLPAYLLFTSGSTGRPKGVVVRHRSAVNLSRALARAIYAHHGPGPLQVSVNAPLAFDASIKQVLQLLSGHTLHLIPEEVRRDGEALVAFLRREAVDVLDCTPSQLRLLLGSGLLTGVHPRLVLVGGESVGKDLWETLAAEGDMACYNVYGPTECTVDTTAERIAAGATPNLGRPLPNTEVHLLDALRPVPVGTAGEICIGGAGLALGYAARPDQTAASFVPHPFAATPGDRLYRSGDLARHLPDGCLEYLGRLDDQVKVRGFRVELGEIEAVLSEHPGVRGAVVLARESEGGPRLVAYVVPRAPRLAGLTGRERHRLPNGLSIYLLDRTETDYMFEEIFEDRCYLRHGLTLGEEAVVFDVGANIGLFTLFVSQVSPRARIYAFEPIPEIFEVLRANAGLYAAGVRLFACGLSDRAGQARFTYYPRFSSRSGLSAYADLANELEVTRRHMSQSWQGALESGQGGFLEEMEGILAGKLTAETVEAPLRRLSDVVREEGVERIDLLKVDVQRAELDVLRGLDAEVWARVEQVAMEVHDEPGGPTEGRVSQITDLLAGHGFEVLAEQDETLRGTDRYQLVASRRGLSESRQPAAAPAPAAVVERAAAAPPAGELTAALLRGFLEERLPEHMLPADLVFLDELPYNRSGKVDRSVLPAPEEVRDAGERPVLAPRTLVEEVLASLYGDVLGARRLGVDESFFDLGGHSLLATQLVSRVREAFRIELPLRALFETPTVTGLARQVEARLHSGLGARPRIEPAPRQGDLPLSYAQESLWVLHQWNPRSASYNSARVLHVEGRLDPAVVEAVLTEVVRRHEVLRTTFPSPQGVPVQRIAPPAPVRLSRVDLSHLPAPERASEAYRRAREQVRKPFDLAVDAPLRVALLRLAEEEHVLVLTLHHIACDGWSLVVLEREVAALYEAFSAGRPSPLTAPALQYADFASWQRQWLRGQVLDEHVAYWKARLAGAPPELDLPHDPAPSVPEPGAAIRSFTIPADMAEGLYGLGRKHGATLYMTLLAAFGLLLSRTSGQEDLVVGTAVAGRDRIEVEGLVGLFINMLPMRLDLGGVPSFLKLLARVREATLSAYMHQGLPFEKLVEELPQARSSARNPVFQVAFGVQNLPTEPFELPGLVFTPWQIGGEETRLELTLWIAESPQGLRALWTYDPSLFQASTIERWHAQLVRLLGSVLANPEACILDLELLGEEERQEMESRRQQREAARRHRLRTVQRRSVVRS